MNLKPFKVLWAKYVSIRSKTRIEHVSLQVVHELLDAVPRLIAECERLQKALEDKEKEECS